MCNSLRDDEKFVIEALSVSLGGSWRPGEDPPDAYLKQGNVEVAVEISTLAQHVADKSGTYKSCRSQDFGILQMCDELNKEIGGSIPSGLYLILTLNAPVNGLRKFKKNLKNKLLEIVDNITFGQVFYININGMNVKLEFKKDQSSSGNKIIGIVGNENSNPRISSNAELILTQSIRKKTCKCLRVMHRPLWLVLLNEYWLANPDSYKEAINNYSEPHPFEKIYLISRNREINLLYET